MLHPVITDGVAQSQKDLDQTACSVSRRSRAFHDVVAVAMDHLLHPILTDGVAPSQEDVEQTVCSVLRRR